MTYIAATDFGQRALAPYCVGLTLSEGDLTNLDAIILGVTDRVEQMLCDDFEPPSPDNDEIVEVNSSGGYRLYTPRRVRSLTTVKTRDWGGALTTQASTAYRLRSSLNAAGTAMTEKGSKLDWLEALPGLSTGCWPDGTNSVQLTGKFGWAAVPFDVKRLVALLTYDLVKAKADPLSRLTTKITIDATWQYGPSDEITELVARYKRPSVMVA